LVDFEAAGVSSHSNIRVVRYGNLCIINGFTYHEWFDEYIGPDELQATLAGEYRPVTNKTSAIIATAIGPDNQYSRGSLSVNSNGDIVNGGTPIGGLGFYHIMITGAWTLD